MTTREQIIAAAKEVDAEINIHGPDETTDRISMHPSQLEAFYAIAHEAGRVAEREECAKVCDFEQRRNMSDYEQGGEDTANILAESIRARSTK